MTQSLGNFKGLYEQGLIIIDEINKQNDGLQLLIEDKDKEIIELKDLYRKALSDWNSSATSLHQTISDLNAHISRLGAENEKLLNEIRGLNDELKSFR